jgi:hypothetical protein
VVGAKGSTRAKVGGGAGGRSKERRDRMNPKPMEKSYCGTVDVSSLYLKPGYYVHIQAGEHAVEVVYKDDGTLQVCIDDETLAAGVHRFEDIYGPDPFKD